MTYHFHPEAELELNQAITYYEECKPQYLTQKVLIYLADSPNPYGEILTLFIFPCVVG